jgi:hypothetical protein
MPAKAKRTSRVRKSRASSQPVRLVVRRGADQRFAKLKEKTADLDVVVSWDRREGERRTKSKNVSGERRKQERRQGPSFTWEMADFAVVVETSSKE